MDKKGPKLGIFYPKTCEIAIALCTPEKRPHARTHIACTFWKPLCTHTHTRATAHRTCACTHAASQLTPWISYALSIGKVGFRYHIWQFYLVNNFRKKWGCQKNREDQGLILGNPLCRCPECQFLGWKKLHFRAYRNEFSVWAVEIEIKLFIDPKL